VESLTAARNAAVAGSEPSDAVRVVNAVLTAIDALRTRPNVLLLTTSNVSSAIDVAFIDRADIKAYIGPPTIQARYDILSSTLIELTRVGAVFFDVDLASTSLPPPASSSVASSASVPKVIASASSSSQQPQTQSALSISLLTFQEAKQAREQLIMNGCRIDLLFSSSSPDQHQASPALPACYSPQDQVILSSALLLECASRCEGFSGRSLRKLPLQAHAKFVRTTKTPAFKMALALIQACRSENVDRKELKS
jgi:hypothetical protein